MNAIAKSTRMLVSSAISEPVGLICPIAADEARTMPGSGGEMHVAMERCDRVLARKTKVPIGTKADDIRGHKRRVRGTATLVILGAGAGGVAEMHEGEEGTIFVTQVRGDKPPLSERAAQQNCTRHGQAAGGMRQLSRIRAALAVHWRCVTASPQLLDPRHAADADGVVSSGDREHAARVGEVDAVDAALARHRADDTLLAAREDLDLARAGATRSDQVGAELLAELRAVEQARLLAAALVQHGVWSPRHLTLNLARLEVPQLQLVAGPPRAREQSVAHQVERVTAHVRPVEGEDRRLGARVPHLHGVVPAGGDEDVRVGRAELDLGRVRVGGRVRAGVGVHREDAVGVALAGLGVPAAQLGHARLGGLVVHAHLVRVRVRAR
eukprot:scaffold83722_cov69-Phaeocystis_antarctica.AAC.1